MSQGPLGQMCPEGSICKRRGPLLLGRIPAYAPTWPGYQEFQWNSELLL